jgi:hypothetical protein
MYLKDYREGDAMPGLHPVELSNTEVERLMRAFVVGKTEVLEDDCLTVLKWAMAQCMGAFLVELMLEGTVRPVVENGEVKVELATAAAH